MHRLLIASLALLALGQPLLTHGQVNGPLVFGVAAGQQPGQISPLESQPAKPGTAVIRGRVTAGDLGLPLRKAQVRVISNGPSAPGKPPESRSASTDENGRYEFRQLRAGRYTVMVSKAGGYVTLSYGQQRLSDPLRPLDVLDGQLIEGVDVALPRGGVITGRVLDEFGDPLTDAQVAAARMQNAGGTRRLLPAGRMATTNDIGEFRLFALPPGNYYLSATVRSQNNGFGDADDRNGYAPTYYPGTADLGAAQKLTVAIGQTINDVSFSVLPIRTARVSGIAVDSQGRPIRGFVVAIIRSNALMALPGSNSGQIRPDGTFTINGLTPGDYTLQLQPQGGAPNGPDNEYATADVTVTGSDINGAQLVLTSPSTIRGRVVISAEAATSLRPSNVRVGLQPLLLGGPIFGPVPQPTQVSDDWTFQTKARAGSMRVTTSGLAPPWTIKAVRHRGTDVTDTGIEVKQGEDLTDIEVELTDRITTVSGIVVNNRGEPTKEYWTVLFARDRDKWRSFRHVRITRSDRDGRFKTIGLPPGDYLALALESVDPNEANDPDFLERIQHRSMAFSLAEGETRTLDLKLSTLP